MERYHNDDPQMRAERGESSNPLCPDHSSHSENAADRLFPDWTRRLLTAEEQALVDAEADLEYMACEGH